MRAKGTRRPDWAGRNPPVGQPSAPPRVRARAGTLNRDLDSGIALYEQFNHFGPSRMLRIRHPRVIPPVVVELGELAGLIYRSDKGRAGQPLTYIHVMQDPPRLVSNIEGTQLYILGGSYHVTQRGIEG